MQINDGNLLGISQPPAGQTERTGQTGAGPGARAGVEPGVQDAVQLSSFASRINELQQDAPARQTRVEELRSLYLSGQYEVDPAALAQAVVDAHVRG